jgi:hypothetical protein
MRFLKPILAGAALLTVGVPALASAQSYYDRDYGHRDYGYSRDYSRSYGDRDYGWRWRHHYRYGDDYRRHHQRHMYDNDYRYGGYWR